MMMQQVKVQLLGAVSGILWFVGILLFIYEAASPASDSIAVIAWAIMFILAGIGIFLWSLKKFKEPLGT